MSLGINVIRMSCCGVEVSPSLSALQILDVHENYEHQLST